MSKTQVFKDQIRHGPSLLAALQRHGGRASFERLVGDVESYTGDVSRSELAGALRRLANAGYVVHRNGGWAATPRGCSFAIRDGGEREEHPVGEVPEWARWKATMVFRGEHGWSDHVFWLEEIYDIHEAVEGGPHWDAIENIEVVRVNHVTSPTLTVEAAAALAA